MKRITRVVVVVLALVLTMGLYTAPAFAASSSSLKTKVEKAEKQLVSYAEYWGWTAKVSKPVVKSNKATMVVSLSNSKGSSFNNIKITATAKKVAYRFKGVNYTLNGWKAALKRYHGDYKSVLKEKARIAGDKLQKTAKKYGWKVTRGGSGEKYKNGKAYDTLKFENAKYHWKATVITARKNGKIVTSYTRDGKASDVKGINAWLKTYSGMSGIG